MKRSLRDDVRFATRRRGVTLIEMLITLAILLLMMTVIVQIFQAATGALNSAQVYQELDNQLRLLDSTLRSDLNGVTCKLTPPNDPKNNPGYLEYGENEFADVQGEDSDDYIRFTAKAPAGRPFTGRMWVPPLNSANLTATQATSLFLASYQPITITSEYAEIIYFLRNGNLYRRVLLVAPERQSTILPTINNTATFVTSGGNVTHTYNASGLGGNAVSWQSVNDLSAHPAPTGAPYHGNSVVLNSLADLTNRENRWAYQRFSGDFQDLTGARVAGGDGLTDDVNGDNVPDYYPTLYPSVLPAALGGTGPPANAANQLIYEPFAANLPPVRMAFGAMAFPFVFPGAYSVPQSLTHYAYGWIHSPNPVVNIGSPSAPVGVIFEGNTHGTTLNYLQNLNHNPLDTGDNLSIPANQGGPNVGYQQTWWGFPTWRETLSPYWADPTVQVNATPGQPFGLAYQPASAGLANPLQLLPDMTGRYRNNPQLFNDGLPNNANPNPVPNGFFYPLDANGNPPPLWSQYSWEDDLIMTGVRSFDIKAYDNSLAAYVDLGWGDDPRLTSQLTPTYLGQTTTTIPYLAGNLDPVNGYSAPAYAYINGGKFDLLNQTFAHEGRMPPLQNDNRLDASYPNPNYTNYTVPYPNANYTYIPQYQGYTNYSSNVGDDNPMVVRLRRVWDSWSTEYTQAPATGVNPAGSAAEFFPAGPPSTPPIYPSYPAPYPAPLRGIQIQIRVTDPTNQRIKTLTIRQDFTDKL